jgi:hypothetical protein
VVRVGYHSIAYCAALKFLLDRHAFNVGLLHHAGVESPPSIPECTRSR